MQQLLVSAMFIRASNTNFIPSWMVVPAAFLCCIEAIILCSSRNRKATPNKYKNKSSIISSIFAKIPMI